MWLAGVCGLSALRQRYATNAFEVRLLLLGSKGIGGFMAKTPM